MSPQEFQHIAEYEWEHVPERFKKEIRNVAFLVEDEPDDRTREEEHLGAHGTLLGLYRGIPAVARGSEYGVGMTLPDTITLYRLPILDEAAEMDRDFRDAVRIVVRETLWHEIGHYLGLDEHAVQKREDEGTNTYTG